MSNKLTLTEQLADKYQLSPDAFMHLMKNQFISVGRNDPPPTNAEMALLMLAINKYDLDPNLRQIHAFRHRGKLQIMVGVDGWIAFANRQPGYQGVKYEYSETMVDTPDGKGKKCWEWVSASIHSEGRVPTEVFCFLDEWYQPQKGYPGPWQTMTRHRLRQKALTQAIREHYGFAVYDDVDQEIMSNNSEDQMLITDKTDNNLQELAGQLKSLNTDNKTVDLDEKGRPNDANSPVNEEVIEAEIEAEPVQEDMFTNDGGDDNAA